MKTNKANRIKFTPTPDVAQMLDEMPVGLDQNKTINECVRRYVSERKVNGSIKRQQSVETTLFDIRDALYLVRKQIDERGESVGPVDVVLFRLNALIEQVTG